MYPFERFSEDSKQVLTMAQHEAEAAGYSYIGTEHILLGLIQQAHGLAAVALRNMGIQDADARSDIERLLKSRGVQRTKAQQLVPTSRVKRIIEMAFEEAQRESVGQVETGHLLIGLLLERDGIAAHVLNERGVTLQRARDEIAGLRNSGKAESSGGGPGPTRRHLGLTDLNGRAIGVDILFPAGYSPAEQDAMASRIRQVVEQGGKS